MSATDPLAELRRALAGRYEVERLIASGGMGSVFLGRDPTLDRPVAIKVIAQDLAASATLRERFLREARTVARLRHPHIVAVYAAGENDGLLWFVMEYVDGESLRSRLEREHRWSGPEAVAALADLANALAYAHGQGVVHRDVKPENILLERATGRALLTDFGVAQALSGGEGDGRMTGTGMVVGSPFYMSPEQAAGERALDGRSDLYSLGLVAYEMLSGGPVIRATSVTGALMKQLTERPPALRERAPDVPAHVAAAIDRALEKEPDARFADAAAFAAALGGAGPGSPAGGVPRAAASGSPAPVRRPLVRRLGAAVAGLALLAAGAWAAFGRGAAGAGLARNGYLVAPFEVLTGDRDLAWLREGSVSMLSLALAEWRDLSVVDYERSLDLLREAKVPDEARVSLEDARGMARRAGVATVVTGQVTRAGDSLRVVARLYDVASGRKLDQAERAAGAAEDPRPLFELLARDLLDLVGAPTGVATAKLSQSTTSSVTAYRAYLEGVRALNRWQLGTADSLFRAAITADSTFALAYYRLANVLGWRSGSDGEKAAALTSALRFAARLPARERGIVEAYAKLEAALRAPQADGGPRVDSLYREAQAAYRAVLARDSADAEVWFGLGDAYYHHRPDGWGAGRTIANWSRALEAFRHTLALDSSFYLAYTHRIDIYRWAGGQAEGALLEGDSVRLLDAAQRKAYGAERLQRAQAAAEGRAMADARAWIRQDPSPAAYVQLAFLHASSRRFDSAAAVTREALRQPETRSEMQRFMVPAFEVNLDPATALNSLREALRVVDTSRLREEATGTLYEVLLEGGAAAVLAGRPSEADPLTRIAAAAANPFATVDGKGPRWWALGSRLALGFPVAPLRAEADAAIAALDGQPGDVGRMRRFAYATLPYLLFDATGDRRDLATAIRWANDADSLPELRALAALQAGDSAAARRLLRSFPDPDSLFAAGSGQALPRWVVRARVLTALGDVRGALRYLDRLEPARFASPGGVNLAWGLWPRALVLAGDLHARQGDADAAAAAYRRVLAMWQDPEPALQPERRRVQAALAALGDAPQASTLPAEP